jgi:hypothetical protein
MCTASGKLFCLVLSALLLISVNAAIEQEFLPHTHTLHEMTLRMVVIEERYQEIEFEIAIEQLASIRQQCDHLMPGLQPSQQQEAAHLIIRTLLAETVLQYYQGNKADAEAVANELLRKDPAAVLSGTLATPELAEWFEDIRDRHTGFMTVTSSPSGADVYLDGLKLGPTPLENTFAPVGHRQLEIHLDGFTVFTEEVKIEHNEMTRIDVTLRRNTGSLILWISPPGTSIDMDHLSGPIVTEPLPALLYPLITAMGYHPSAMSEPLKIRSIPVGERHLSIHKDCRQPVNYRIEFDAEDYYLPLMILHESETQISVFSTPDDADVFIDGQFSGVTPLLDKTVCPGERRFTVDYGNDISWSKTVHLEPDSSAEFHAIPRPDLLYLGCFSSYRDQCITFESKIYDILLESEMFNLVDPLTVERYRIRPTVATVLESLMSPNFKPEDSAWQKRLQDMITSFVDTPSHLIAFARPVPAGSEEKSFIVFIHKDSAKPDVLYFSVESEEFKDDFRNIMRSAQLPPTTRLRTGLRVTEMAGSMFITEVIPGSNAEISPLRTGDRIVSLNNTPVSSRQAFEAILRNPESPELMPVSFERRDQILHASVQMTRQPLIVSLRDNRTPYNIHYAHLSILTHFTQTDPVWLTMTLGVCSLAMNRPDKAAHYLQAAELSDKEGLGRGTLAWLKHLAADARRSKTESDEWFRKAMESSESTIIHGDGPLLEDMLQ